MSTAPLDTINHIAISVENIEEAVSWYTQNFLCSVEYQDKTWAMLKFANISLALVIPRQHPPHIALERENAEDYGKLKTHRDGTKSVYIKDPFDNAVEIMAKT
jgi:hypothetical protein